MTVETRLLARRRIDPHTGCWEWLGACDKSGCGRIRVGSKSDGTGKIALVRRAAHEVFIGPIPAAHDVRQRCNNLACFNPHHLFTTLRVETVQDCIEKGAFHFAVPQPGEAHPFARLREIDILEIRASKEKPSVLAEKYGCVTRHIRMIRTGASSKNRAWTHVPT